MMFFELFNHIVINRSGLETVETVRLLSEFISHD